MQTYSDICSWIYLKESNSFICKRQSRHIQPMNQNNHNSVASLQDLYYVSYNTVTRRELYEKQYKIIRVISGVSVLTGGDKTIKVYPGEYVFVNQGGFSRITMYPKKKKPFKLICLNFSDKFLHKYRDQNLIPALSEQNIPPFVPVAASVPLSSLFASLQVYAQHNAMPHQPILNLKLEECLHILEREQYALFCRLLSHQTEVKNNLKEFMENNYFHNAPLERFAKLSGRSLSSFRREFIEVFGETPNKWLIRKRVEKGYEMLIAENCRPIDIYWELGFETLAHFSRKFKEQYGITPSELRKKGKEEKGI